MPTSSKTQQTETGIILGLMAPAMMTGIYTAMFSVALPIIRTHFDIQADMAAWVATVYTLPFMMFMPLYGRLGDSLGKRRLFMLGIALFILGTTISVLANNLGWFMLGQAIQGCGTAGFVPLALAIISQLFPANERGKLMGTWNLAFPVTGLIGPFVGGFLIQYLGWRSIFWPSLLIGLLTLFMVKRQVPPLPGPASSDFLRKFDWGGVILLSITLTSMLFYTSSRPITGVAALQDWRLFIVMLLFLVSFVFWERHCKLPFIPLQLYRYTTFTLSSICAGIRMFTMTGVRFLVPLYLVDIYHRDAVVIGLVIAAHALPLLLLIRLGGQLADRWGSRRLVVLSLLFQAIAMAYLALLPEDGFVWLVVLGVLGHSASAGFSLAALHRSSLLDIPEEQTGVAAGLYSMLRFAGTVFGNALSGVVLQYGLSQATLPIEAYQQSFWFIALVTLCGAFIGLRLKA